MSELKNLDWDELVDKLQAHATSLKAGEHLIGLGPCQDENQAYQSMTDISQACQVLASGERPFMESLDLFSTWCERLKKHAVLKALELKDVRRFFHEVLALREVFRPAALDWPQRIFAQLFDPAPELARIDRIMTQAGEIRSDASETLHRLTLEKSQTARSVQQLLDKLIKQHDMEPILRDRYVTSREGRWVLPVRSGMQHAFAGIVHAASQSKQTFFIEPQETVTLNNRLAKIEIEIEIEIERILTELSQALAELTPSFEQTAQAMLKADIRLAQAQLTQQLGASACRFSEERISLTRLRHPLLALTPQPVIANNVYLDPSRGILMLSGPNAGGKTVLLKSIGLAAQMARCGLCICAEENSTLPFFAKILVSIGDSQSVDAQLSTFAAHLKVLNQAALEEGPSRLLLIDEIAGSTDPEEGAALARAFIERFAANKVYGVITSHMGPLKQGWSEESRVINGSLEYDSQSARPTYQFLLGVPGHSLALQTARRVGIDDAILDRAHALLSPAARSYQQSLDQVALLKDELSRLRDMLNSEIQSARSQKNKYHQLVEAFRKDRNAWLERAFQKAEKKIDELIEKAKVDNIFKKHEVLTKIHQSFPEIHKAQNVSRFSDEPAPIDSAEEFARKYPPGSTVFVASIGQDGVVQGVPNAKGELPVLANSMRLFVHWQALKPARQMQNPTAQILRRASLSVPLADQDRVVDLRGQRVEDALESLELQLDTAALGKEDRVKIIHGHGTEALKRAIRTYLSRSLYVKKWQAGLNESGGDGVTWVELRDED